MKTVLLAFLLIASPAYAQVGKSLGVVDANTASEQMLLSAPNMSAPAPDPQGARG